ncbi:hypothetical protein VNO77_26991 [Canavalia gladiata]|uniref:Uncharacterized protein n=1 Tax=Canavalia gladiata TaxID=3824 RepID=A0AAN9KX02_CANGL
MLWISFQKRCKVLGFFIAPDRSLCSSGYTTHANDDWLGEDLYSGGSQSERVPASNSPHLEEVGALSIQELTREQRCITDSKSARYESDYLFDWSIQKYQQLQQEKMKNQSTLTVVVPTSLKPVHVDDSTQIVVVAVMTVNNGSSNLTYTPRVSTENVSIVVNALVTAGQGCVLSVRWLLSKPLDHGKLNHKLMLL